MEEIVIPEITQKEPVTSSDNYQLDTSFDLLKTDGFDVSKILDKEIYHDSFDETEESGISQLDHFQEMEDSSSNDFPSIEVSKGEINFPKEEIPIEKTVEEPILETLKEEVDIPKLDLKNIFEIANNNVREATNIFNKNLEMKRKIELQKQEIDRIRQEHEDKCREEIIKVKEYKAEVYQKLKAKKEEVEKQIQSFKDMKANFELEKNKFEIYKRNETDRIKKEQEKIENLELRESELKIREEKLMEKEKQLDLDLLKYKTDQEELSSNLQKFNELVGAFTSNVEKISE